MDYVEEQGVSIVANGTFNPSIFHPAWLCRQDLITPDEEASATVDVCHPEIAQFSVPGMKFEVQTERAVIHAISEPFIRAAEVFFQIFGTLLPHCPINTAGINYWAHFSAKDWGQRQRFARTLAPIEPWGDFGRLMGSDDKSQAGGFSTLSMRANYPTYGKEGSINIHVQPSVKIPNDVGIFVSVNHHIASLPLENPAEEILARYDDSIMFSRNFLMFFMDRVRSS